MSRPPFDGTFPVTAGWRYSSGAGHFAHDYATPLGTELKAIADGEILDCADGTPNNAPGVNPGSNAPSNWVLLGTKLDGEDVTVYYQHMSPGLRVTRGDQVKEGTVLGRSGNSGNSSGPHLHLATQRGHTTERYRYMDNDGTNPFVIYPPSCVWHGEEEDEMTHEDREWVRKMVREQIDADHEWTREMVRNQLAAAIPVIAAEVRKAVLTAEVTPHKEGKDVTVREVLKLLDTNARELEKASGKP